MQEIKIFLASSNELKDDRKAFLEFIAQINKRSIKKGIHFIPVHWEDHPDAIAAAGKQADYNKSLDECDILVVLFWTKVGKYTNEEFETGYKRFIETGCPQIYVYKKVAPYLPGTREQENSRYDFEDKLKGIKHFVTEYANASDLTSHFNQQITDLYDSTGIKTKSAPTEKNQPLLLTTPPFLPEVFLGREQEQEDIRRRLTTERNLLMLVNGQGGMGKTSLASNYFHKFRYEYNAVAWVYTENNLGSALLQMASGLGFGFPEQADTMERLQILSKELLKLGGPSLLIIDNANEAEDLAAFYGFLHSLSNFHILITSRLGEFEQTTTYKIEGLPENEALVLFKRYYPKLTAEEEPLFQQIRLAVGGNTLVIEMLAKNLAALNKVKNKYSLNSLWTDLQEQGLLKLTKTAQVTTTYHTDNGSLRKAKPEEIIGAMYDIGQLAEAERKLLSVFAVLPAENIPFAILETLLPAFEQLEETALALSQNGWTEYNEASGSFKCSPVVQEITREKNTEMAEDCGPLIDCLIDKLEYQSGTGHLENATYEEAALFSRYAESAVNILEEKTRLLCDRVGRFFLTTGNIYKALRYYEQYARFSNQLLGREPENEDLKTGLAISYQNLGQTWTAMGDLQKARQFYEDETTLFKELYEAFPGNVSFKDNLAISYEKLGETWAAMGDLQKARQFFEEDAQLTKELYEAFPGNVSFKNNLAISYSKLGETWAAMGDLPKARQFYEEYNQLENELYEAFPGNVSFKNILAISYSKLAVFYRDLQPDKSKAKSYFEQCHRLWKELAETFPDYVAFQNNFNWVKEQMEKL